MAIGVNSMKGTDGRITYPAVGALIGESYAWVLFREEKGPHFTLRMNCKDTFHEMLWEEVDGARRIELRISRDVWQEARPIEGAVTTRNGRQITIKGVTLHPLEG